MSDPLINDFNNISLSDKTPKPSSPHASASEPQDVHATIQRLQHDLALLQQKEAMSQHKEAMFRDVLASIHTPTTIEVPSYIKPLKGTENATTVQLFLQQINEEASFRNWNDDAKIYAVSRKLEDSLATWYDNCKTNFTRWDNFDSFAATLTSECEKREEVPRADRMLKQLRQHGSVTEYTDRFKLIIREISSNFRQNLAYLCHEYQTGLSDELYEQSRSHKFQSWQQLSDWALSAETVNRRQRQYYRPFVKPRPHSPRHQQNSNTAFVNRHTSNKSNYSKNG